jgi:hypothetical protein
MFALAFICVPINSTEHISPILASQFIYELGRPNIRRTCKGKAIPVTGHEGPQGCETSRRPHFLDNRLRDGGEVVSLTRRLPFASRKIPGTHLC